MARIRTIKPEFCESQDTAALSRDARLFFLQLLTQVDDDGRYVWSAKRVAGALYPFDDDVTPDMVEGWLAECEARNMAKKYSVGGQSYIILTNFDKHQRINRKTDSKLPPPPFTEDVLGSNQPLELQITEDAVSIHPQLTEVVHREVEVEREVELGNGVPVGTTGKPVVYDQNQIYGQVGYFLSEVARQIGASPPTDAEIRQHIAKSSCVRKILDKCQPMSHAIDVGVFGMKTKPGVGWQGIWAGVSSIEAKLKNGDQKTGLSVIPDAVWDRADEAIFGVSQ